MHKLRLLLLASLITSPTFATILPENTMSIPILDKNEGLSEQQYNDVIDKFEKIYTPIVEATGNNLKIQRLWTSPTVNAGTLRSGRNWILKMYGGYARHPLATEDGYTLVLCHELGHHLGGVPRKRGWPSVEGQADYFALLKCMREVFKKDDNESVIARVVVPEEIKKRCSRAFEEPSQAAICIRTTLAGLANAAVSASIRHTEVPKVETPDTSIVEETYEAHPKPQCRLDTYFQASLCTVRSTRRLGDDEVKGACHEATGFTEGLRPACWFKSSI